MLWVYDRYDLFNSFNAEIVFRRQIIISLLKTVPVELFAYFPRHLKLELLTQFAGDEKIGLNMT